MPIPGLSLAPANYSSKKIRGSVSLNTGGDAGLRASAPSRAHSFCLALESSPCFPSLHQPFSLFIPRTALLTTSLPQPVLLTSIAPYLPETRRYSVANLPWTCVHCACLCHSQLPPATDSPGSFVELSTWTVWTPGLHTHRPSFVLARCLPIRTPSPGFTSSREMSMTRLCFL